jgi:hypothetical protein
VESVAIRSLLELSDERTGVPFGIPCSFLRCPGRGLEPPHHCWHSTLKVAFIFACAYLSVSESSILCLRNASFCLPRLRITNAPSQTPVFARLARRIQRSRRPPGASCHGSSSSALRADRPSSIAVTGPGPERRAGRKKGIRLPRPMPGDPPGSRKRAAAWAECPSHGRPA